MFIVAAYVNDLIAASKLSIRIYKFLKNLSENFSIKDMGKLHYFFGDKVVYPESGKFWIGQPTYIAEVLKNFQMKNFQMKNFGLVNPHT